MQQTNKQLACLLPNTTNGADGLFGKQVAGVKIGPIASVVRSFRVGRVVRLVKGAKSLRNLFNTFMATLPSENLLLAEEEMEREDSMTVDDVVPMRVSIWGDEEEDGLKAQVP